MLYSLKYQCYFMRPIWFIFSYIYAFSNVYLFFVLSLKFTGQNSSDWIEFYQYFLSGDLLLTHFLISKSFFVFFLFLNWIIKDCFSLWGILCRPVDFFQDSDVFILYFFDKLVNFRNSLLFLWLSLDKNLLSLSVFSCVKYCFFFSFFLPDMFIYIPISIYL